MDGRTIEHYDRSAVIHSKSYEAIDSPLAGQFRRFFRAEEEVLDIGCANGRDLAVLRSMGVESFGLEPSAGLRRRAVALHPELKSCIFPGSVPGDTGSLGARTFDGIVLSAVIMHIPDSELTALAMDIRRLIRDKGRVIISHSPVRGDVAGDGRDARGRLFRLRSSAQIRELFEGAGFAHTAFFASADVLERRGTVWETLVFIRR